MNCKQKNRKGGKRLLPARSKWDNEIKGFK